MKAFSEEAFSEEKIPEAAGGEAAGETCGERNTGGRAWKGLTVPCWIVTVLSHQAVASASTRAAVTKSLSLGSFSNRIVFLRVSGHGELKCEYRRISFFCSLGERHVSQECAPGS